ncbi:MAG: DUF6090 family protein [Gemmatimonadota bacterium]|nr:DUF6090 family protein [Gemmatimonadota bacterium]MDH5759294.1 DUF6090 family protein [Gemmatimonadota bacterium]
MSHESRWPWRRMLKEGVLIVGSVYVAIVLEGVSAQRARVADARADLAQLRSELQADLADLAEIVGEQEELAAQYARLLRWLATPEDMPNDSVHAALERLATSNRTLFPRRGAWTSLVSGGQLASLGDGALVSRLANFYENIVERLEYNGASYDRNVDEVMRETVSASWDKSRRRPVGDAVRLRNDLAYLELAWTRFYLDLLREHERESMGLLDDIAAFLHGT